MVKTSYHTIAILAYNNHEITIKNIKHLIDLGYRKNILLFDNGSNPSFKDFCNEFNIRFQRVETNIYVNPAWNIIFNQENCNYLTLLNNDCFILSPLYFEHILEDMKKNNIGISSCKTRNVINADKDLNTNNYFKYHKFIHREGQKLKFFSGARRQGWLMTIDLFKYKKLDFQIPNYVKLWFGDDWIWGQFIMNNKKYGVYKNKYAIHIKNTTIDSSEEFEILVKEDIKNIEKYGNWYRNLASKLHVKSRLFNKYV
tara:strand:+ start:1624 stop:2391 length:768 start_codon:yes stop_codon:yes gene_type:complete